MLGRIFRSMAATALENFRETIASRRIIVASVLVGFAFILSAWAFANSAVLASEAETPPTPLALWHMGADGALVSLAYGIAPLVVPLLPIIIAYDTLKKDRTTGFLETAMSRPVPRWGIPLGKFAGIFAAIAIPLVALTFGSAFLIQTIVGAPVPTDFTLDFVASTLFLAALYLSLVLLMGTLLAPSTVPGLYLLLWIAFNTIRTSALIIGGQFLSLLLRGEPLTFRVVWNDLATFTGLYQGLMAVSVPETLNFVIWSGPSNGGALVPYWSVPLGGGLWLAGLLALYTLFLTRYPLG